MRGLLGWLAFASMASCVAAQAQSYGVTTRTKIEYAQHDGAKLAGDLYLPKGLDKAPLLIAAHGGGWQVGSPASYRYWGPYSRQERLRAVRDQLPVVEAGREDLSGRGL
jgi:poly(3-hydroxybutyrate) depolymerase